MDLVKALSSQYMKPELPEMRVGDTVRVHVRIKEGSRERIQVFEGTIIARKHGGIGESITVRRISSGVGCEQVFAVHSPNVAMVETVRKGEIGKDGVSYIYRGGVALETQFFPDSVNRPEWKQPFVKAGQRYHSITSYKFL